MITVDSINLDPWFLFIIRENKHVRKNLWKKHVYISPYLTRFFEFQKILIKFNIQIYWNLAIFSLKLSNDPSDVWHLCHRCVKNVPMLYIAGSRHLYGWDDARTEPLLYTDQYHWTFTKLRLHVHESFHKKKYRFYCESMNTIFFM